MASSENTHTPCQGGKGSSTSEAANVRLDGWLVHAQLPTPLTKGWPWHPSSFAPTQKRYQIWDLRAPLVSVLCSYGKFTKYTLSSSLPTCLPRSLLPASVPLPHLDTDPPPRFPPWKGKTVCGIMHTWWVRTRAALRSPSCKYWQLQVKVLRVVDIDTTF